MNIYGGFNRADLGGSSNYSVGILKTEEEKGSSTRVKRRLRETKVNRQTGRLIFLGRYVAGNRRGLGSESSGNTQPSSVCGGSGGGLLWEEAIALEQCSHEHDCPKGQR